MTACGCTTYRQFMLDGVEYHIKDPRWPRYTGHGGDVQDKLHELPRCAGHAAQHAHPNQAPHSRVTHSTPHAGSLPPSSIPALLLQYYTFPLLLLPTNQPPS